MKLSKFALSLSALFFASLFHAQTLAKSAGRVVVYCSAQNIVCEKAVQGFSEKYNVTASFIRNSSGSTLAKMLAEKIILKPMCGLAVHSTRTYKRWN